MKIIHLKELIILMCIFARPLFAMDIEEKGRLIRGVSRVYRSVKGNSGETARLNFKKMSKSLS